MMINKINSVVKEKRGENRKKKKQKLDMKHWKKD